MSNQHEDETPDSGDAGSVDEGSAPAPGAGSVSFWECGPGVHALDDPTPFGQENALQKLGKPPFEKTTRSRFRLLGYLATVYEHVSQDVRGNGEQDDSPAGPAAPE